MPSRNESGNVADTTPTAETFFEPRLRELGLTVDAIEQQTLEELKESLDRVNDALSDRRALGDVSVISMTAHTGLVTPHPTSSSDRYLTVSILPLLVDRKRLILTRIRELGDQPAEQLLESLAEGSTNPNGLTKEVAAAALDQLRAGRAAGQQEAAIDQDLMKLRERFAIYESKAKIWQGFLARESIASIVGGLLLLALATTLVVAMFVGTTTTPVVANAFLIILGYFFGQAASRERQPHSEPER